MRTLPAIRYVIINNNVHTGAPGGLYLEYNDTSKRVRRRISMRIKVPDGAWINRDGLFFREKGKSVIPNAKEYNFALRNFLQKGNNIILTAFNNGQNLTFEDFRKELLSEKDKLAILDLHNTLMLNNIDRYESTKITYRTRYNKLMKFAPELRPSELNLAFVKKYHFYLRENLKLHPNSIYRELWYVRKLCEIAVKNKSIASNPFDEYPLKKILVKKKFLTIEEVERLKNLFGSKALSESLQEVLRCFLFACYTGLDYSDLQRLNFYDIQQTTGTYFINKKRAKNAQWYFVPVVGEALELIKPIRSEEDSVFKTISNTKANSVLKKIISMCGIRKHVNFKTARHTFATVNLNLGVRREVVQGMMGHTTSRMTDHYAKLIQTTILKEVNNAWSNRG